MADTNASPRKNPTRRPEKKSSRPPERGNGNGRVQSIHLRAYEIYQERLRNNQPGDMISDWVQAEQEFGLVVPGKKSGA